MRYLKKFLITLTLILALVFPVACQKETPVDDTGIADLPSVAVFSTGRWLAGKQVYNGEEDDYFSEEKDYLYLSTQLFTKETLPVGSYVRVGQEVTCEAVVWTEYPNKEGAEVRTNLVKKGKINIDEAWWKEITTCAFTFSKKEGSTSPMELSDMVRIVSTKPSTIEYNWNDDGVLKILTVGNSFSEDMMQHVYQIAQDVGIEKIVLGNLSYPACRLSGHHTFWTANSPSYYYYTNTTGTWQVKQKATFEEAFEINDWDYISFQESAQEIQTKQALYQYLPILIQMAKTRCPNAKIIWHMPWANEHANYSYDVKMMYHDLCKATRTIIQPISDIQMIIPCGTAIENMRTSWAYSDSLLLRDGWHLSQNIGKYIVGLTLVKQLTGMSIDNVTWVPSKETEEYRLIAIEAANNAVANPFTITPSVYVEK